MHRNYFRITTALCHLMDEYVMCPQILITVSYLYSTEQIVLLQCKLEKAVRDCNLHQLHAMLPACNKSCDVIDHVTTRFIICHFLLVVYCNRVSVSNRFRDIWPQHVLTKHTDTHIH